MSLLPDKVALTWLGYSSILCPVRIRNSIPLIYAILRALDGDVIKIYSSVVAVSLPVTGGMEVLVKIGEQLHVPLQGTWPAPQSFTMVIDDLPWSANHAKD